jgi:hypothetical protein
MTTVLKILLMCCIAQSLLAILQATTCPSSLKSSKPTPCSTLFGVLGCAVLVVTIFQICKTSK